MNGKRPVVYLDGLILDQTVQINVIALANIISGKSHMAYPVIYLAPFTNFSPFPIVISPVILNPRPNPVLG